MCCQCVTQGSGSPSHRRVSVNVCFARCCCVRCCCRNACTARTARAQFTHAALTLSSSSTCSTATHVVVMRDRHCASSSLTLSLCRCCMSLCSADTSTTQYEPGDDRGKENVLVVGEGENERVYGMDTSFVVPLYSTHQRAS